MPSRAELELRATAIGLDPSTIPANDSVLEQRVIDAEKNADTATGTLATQTLTSTGVNVSNNDTVTIGSTTYTFKTTLSSSPAVANEVKIGADAATSLDYLKIAINNSGGTQGTEYSYGTTAHPRVTATTNTNTTQVVEARRKNYGNSIATTETAATLSWGAATLTGGVPAVVAPTEVGKRGVSGGAAV